MTMIEMLCLLFCKLRSLLSDSFNPASVNLMFPPLYSTSLLPYARAGGFQISLSAKVAVESSPW